MKTKTLNKTQSKLLELLNLEKRLTAMKSTRDGKQWKNAREYDAAIALYRIGKVSIVEDRVHHYSRSTVKRLVIELVET